MSGKVRRRSSEELPDTVGDAAWEHGDATHVRLVPASLRRGLAASRSYLTLLLLSLLLPACHLPTPLKDIDDPRLAAVQADFQAVVDHAYHHPTQDWYFGWMGNFWRNWRGGNRRGLCYEWQAVVYEGVRESAPAAGLVAIGIEKDKNESTEHHAVLLFPRGDVVTSDQGATTGPEAGRLLLALPPPRRAWVLDAWRYGHADIFTLDEWLGADFHWRGRIVFEDLEDEYQSRAAKALRQRIEVVSDGVKPSTRRGVAERSDNAGS